jgi:hypothetical protein
MDFRSNVPSVEGFVAVALIISLGSGEASSAVIVGKARRNVSNEILIMDNSESEVDVGSDGSSEDSVTDSGRSESVKEKVVLGNDLFNGNVESSNGSESTTEGVTSDIEIITSVLLSMVLHGRNEFSLELGVIMVIEILGNLSTGGFAESTFSGTGVNEFTGKLNDVGGTSEGNNESLESVVNEGGVGNNVLVSNIVGLLVNSLESGKDITVVTALQVLENIMFTVRTVGSGGKGLGHLFIVVGKSTSDDSGEDKEGKGNLVHRLNSFIGFN